MRARSRESRALPRLKGAEVPRPCCQAIAVPTVLVDGPLEGLHGDDLLAALLGYHRALPSTEEQAHSGLGLEAQRAAINAEVARRGWELVTVLTDAGASGKSLSGRPALAEALAMVRSGDADVLVVAKLDRLSRSLLDFAGLMADAQQRGWVLVALDLGIDLSTPAGEFMASSWRLRPSGSAGSWGSGRGRRWP